MALIGFSETPQALAVAQPRGPVVIDLAGPYALEIPQQVIELQIGEGPGDRGQLRRLKTRSANGLLQLGQGEEAIDVGVPVDDTPGLAQLPEGIHKQGREQQLAAGPWALGASVTLLDCYIAAMYSWGPRQAWFDAHAPKFAAIARAVCQRPELAAALRRNKLI